MKKYKTIEELKKDLTKDKEGFYKVHHAYIRQDAKKKLNNEV